MRTWYDGPGRSPGDVDAGARHRAWEMQRRAIDLENDDAEARSPEPTSGDRLGDVAAPTLVTVGDLDQPDMVAIAEKLAAGIPGAQHVVIPGVAHLPPMERPAEFASLVREFLEA